MTRQPVRQGDVSRRKATFLHVEGDTFAQKVTFPAPKVTNPGRIGHYRVTPVNPSLSRPKLNDLAVKPEWV